MQIPGFRLPSLLLFRHVLLIPIRLRVLLLSDVFERLKRNPSLLREIVMAEPGAEPVIIDEIQRIPALLNEVQWLMVNHGTRFILSGSSPRKILHAGANLLGGRALRYELYPLIYQEIPDFNLIRALLGVELLIKAVTLLLILVGYITGQTALAQSIVITLIVIEVVVMVVASGIILRIYGHTDSVDVRDLLKFKEKDSKNA